MIAKINTEKVVVDGKRARRIIGFSGVRNYEQLPQKYLADKSGPMFYTYLVFTNMVAIYDGEGNGHGLVVGTTIPEEQYQKALKIMKAAGNRLVKIYLEDNWKGYETEEI